MKKIVKLLFIVMICIVPMFGNAKAKFEEIAELQDLVLIDIDKNGNYTFLDASKEMDEEGSVVIFNKKGEEAEVGSLIPKFEEGEEPDLEEIFSSPYMIKYMMFSYYVENNPVILDENNKFYAIDYDDEMISYAGEDSASIDFSFNDNINETKRILGKKYDIYQNVKQYDVNVYSIKEFNNYFAVYYYDDDDNKNYVSIMDSNYNIIKTYEGYEAERYLYYAYDNLIYIMKQHDTLEIYKPDGTLYQTFTVESDLLEGPEECDDLEPVKMYINDNKLFIAYIQEECPSRIESFDASDLVNEDIETVPFLTMAYNLDFDIEKVNSTNGDFTYESKVDENGRSYVELKIEPKKGYSVKEIIVTDSNGNIIPVTSNRFYMPLNDVKVEVKYIEGEYLPIPNTSLSQNLSFVLIGIILISLGMYTMKFVKREEN